MQKKSILYAILNYKCPRCRVGKIFIYPLLQKPLKFTKTHKTCPHCELLFEVEPGFFFGAMYVSYVLTMAIMLVTAFILYYFFDDPEIWVYVTTVIVAVVVLLPVIFRLSRTLYLYAFGGIKYNPSYSEP